MGNASSQETKILDLERKYWDAMKNNDVEAAVSMTRFPCLLASPMGARKVSEDEYRAMMKKANGSEFAGVEIQDPRIHFLNEDTAIITYTSEVRGMRMIDVSTWVRESDKWVCGFHSENPLQ